MGRCSGLLALQDGEITIIMQIIEDTMFLTKLCRLIRVVWFNISSVLHPIEFPGPWQDHSSCQSRNPCLEIFFSIFDSLSQMSHLFVCLFRSDKKNQKSDTNFFLEKPVPVQKNKKTGPLQVKSILIQSIQSILIHSIQSILIYSIQSILAFFLSIRHCI